MYHFPYSSLFILCLLCISFYICTARPLVALHDNVPEKEQENIVKKLHGAEGNSVGGETNNRTTERSKASVEEEVNLKNVKIRSDNNKKKKKKEEDIISGHVPIKSVVSVSHSISWRVPQSHKKQHHDNDHHPGFYSDYSRPRTCPPSHN